MLIETIWAVKVTYRTMYFSMKSYADDWVKELNREYPEYKPRVRKIFLHKKRAAPIKRVRKSTK